MNWNGIAPDRRQYLVCAALLGAAYFFCYGWLLWRSDFLPYVMDNNESFSAFWHARNLYDFGFGKSFGLADESFAYHDAAHPFVHTHQGNFPRIFAFVIYALGARSIESQIFVTTFTVGVVSMLFAYRYFRTVANPLFGLIATVVLITDYVLVTQWQIVTYRVWHMFFLFSTLLCVHGIGGERRRLWLALTIVNYACLFYFELIFVAFVSILAGLYTAWLHRDNPKTVLSGWLCQFGGAVAGLTILVTQLMLYMGWGNFVQDVYLTFVARNEFKEASELLAQIREFYENHNIAFWYNLEDGSRFRKLGYFIASLTSHELQIHTPFFFMLTSILAGAFLLGYWGPVAATYRGSADPSHSSAATWKTAFSFPVAIAMGMVAVFLVRRWGRDEIDLLSLVALLAMPLLLIFSLASESLWSRLLSRAARAWPDIDWRALMPNVIGILILLMTLPSLLTLSPAVLALPVEGAALLYAIFFGTYCLLLAHLAAEFLWRRMAPSEQNRDSMVLLGRGIVGSLLFVSLLLLWVVCLDGDLYLGLPPRFLALRAMDWAGWAGLIALVMASYVTGVSLIGGSRHATKLAFLPRAEMLTATGRFSMFVMLASAFVAISWRLFHQQALPWREFAEQSFLSQPLLQAMIAASIVFAGVMAAFGTKTVLRDSEPKRWNNVLAFLIAGGVAYSIVYVLSPGYIFSGYRFRLVPFSVFHTELIIAIAFYVAIRFFLSHRPIFAGAGRSAMGNGENGPSASVTNSWVQRSAWCLVAGLLACLLVYWFGMQLTYIRLLPPDHYSVLKTLDAAPYRGASFAVGNYAAPVAAYTGQWAYYDPGFVAAKHIREGETPKIVTDDTYLWLADKKTNPDYKRPQYFICLINQTFSSALSRLKDPHGFVPEFGGCSTQYLVRLAMEKRADIYPQLELVAMDKEGPQKVGFESWAIVKLHW